MEMKDSLGIVLVVDDDPKNLELLMLSLESNDYTVRSALNGTLALQSVKDTPPEIILLDIMMPGMDGYEVCRQLKADPATKEIPIIFLSALSEAFDKVKSFNVGAVDYITKPFFVEEVLSRVATHLEICRMRRQDKLRIEQLTHEIDKRILIEKKFMGDGYNHIEDMIKQRTDGMHRLFSAALDRLVEMVEQGASKDELTSYLEDMRKELDIL